MVWYGRCIFLSWYCDVGTCKFCYRSTQKNRIKNALNARRSNESVIVEALLARELNWRIEFLTGGYKIYNFNEIKEFCRLVSEVYGEKIWINLGVLKKEEIEELRPYVEGIVASIECVNKDLHKEICPDKKIEPYVEMLNGLKGLKKSITLVIGLGYEDKKEVFDFIESLGLDRVTFYALKPVEGTPFVSGPTTEEFVSWIKACRERFPKLEIIAGITLRRVSEVDLLLEAGANAITKFPATKVFGSEKAKEFTSRASRFGFDSELVNLPEIDWYAKINELKISEDMKIKVKKVLDSYLAMMGTFQASD